MYEKYLEQLEEAGKIRNLKERSITCYKNYVSYFLKYQNKNPEELTLSGCQGFSSCKKGRRAESHHSEPFPSPEQAKVSRNIINCKTGAYGANVSICEDCGTVQIHYNSCRNRCCPMCQAVPKEMWMDARRKMYLMHLTFISYLQFRIS